MLKKTVVFARVVIDFFSNQVDLTFFTMFYFSNIV